QTRPRHRRLGRKLPAVAAIRRNRGPGVIRIRGIQIAAAYNAMPRIAESHRERASARRADQWSGIRTPGIAPVSGGQNPRRSRATRRNPRVVSPLSLVARTRAVVEPPVAIHALFPPCVATQVPLAANDASPGK